MALSDVAADIAFLGACSLDPAFGLDADKLGRRNRHRVLNCQDLDMLITDASPESVTLYQEQGVEICHA